MTEKAPSAPAEAPRDAAPAPTEGGVSAEAVSEGQTRAIDQQLAALDERARQAKAESSTDAQLQDAPEPEPAPEEEKPKGGWGILASLSAGWTSISSWFGETGKKVGDWLANLLGFKKKEKSDEDHPNPEGVTDEDETPSDWQRTAREMQEIMSNPELGKRIAEMAVLAVNSGQLNNAQHCWNWAEKVCQQVGARFGETIFRTAAYGSPKGRLEDINLMEGDWLYIHNGNKSDKRGDHSVIFLGWKDEGSQLAYAASFPGPGKKARIHTVDFSKAPITSINRPVVA